MLFRPVVGSHEAVHERYVKEKMNLLTLIRSVFAWKVKTFAGSDKVRFLFFSFVSQAPCIDSWVDSLLSFFGWLFKNGLESGQVGSVNCGGGIFCLLLPLGS